MLQFLIFLILLFLSIKGKTSKFVIKHNLHIPATTPVSTKVVLHPLESLNLRLNFMEEPQKSAILTFLSTFFQRSVFI